MLAHSSSQGYDPGGPQGHLDVVGMIRSVGVGLGEVLQPACRFNLVSDPDIRMLHPLPQVTSCEGAIGCHALVQPK